MSVVINMSNMRKALDRAKRKAEADANAVKHGRTKAEVEGEKRAADRSRSWLDGHELDQE